MNDKPIHKGPHDLGGTAAGPIDTTDHGMKFWEKQANALRNTLTRKRILHVDEPAATIWPGATHRPTMASKRLVSTDEKYRTGSASLGFSSMR